MAQRTFASLPNEARLRYSRTRFSHSLTPALALQAAAPERDDENGDIGHRGHNGGRMDGAFGDSAVK